MCKKWTKKDAKMSQKWTEYDSKRQNMALKLAINEAKELVEKM